jgi:capsular polysaccharide transport system permease protein
MSNNSNVNEPTAASANDPSGERALRKSANASRGTAPGDLPKPEKVAVKVSTDAATQHAQGGQNTTESLSGSAAKPSQPVGLKKAAAPQVVQVQPLAQKATMKKRHWGVLFSFALAVLLPLSGIVIYLWWFAEDQYSSTTAFSVRSEEGGSASELLGGLASFAGSGVGGDSDILYEFIQSQGIVEVIDKKLDLREHYASNWPNDAVFALWPDATLEELVWFWQRILRIYYDQSTGLIEIRVLSYDPVMAQQIAEAIVSESQDMINALSTQAREDAMSYARSDLKEAVVTLKTAREALTEFRTRTRIVDPASDLQGRMGVMNNLQQSLAMALIDYDLLRETGSGSDPRVINAARRIDVIRARIAAERDSFTDNSTELDAAGKDYPSLIAEFESLNVDREFAEETYRAALTALDVARGNAARQSRYLATYIPPTLAHSSEFPRRFMLTGLATLFLIMIWAILALVYYSIRDRG